MDGAYLIFRQPVSCNGKKCTI
jgi:hypothetical protein